eukprot:CAMPEP_0202978122 /NCGR_PEP_ID=MMETSP1396-20130829/84653_1 /ASSEMBLY_ACC=CAM_ASM_000872 /TAXON_ID= /ORGANISM="Pseudokeronopsis sp., Strain Brazil" /LENGTH=74 /DNA_ID=CAMNT_0049716993 /DNA_START=1899 /DNA_END=2123 /DNA_ORIENTATION=-
MPTQYLLPHYKADLGELWIRFKYNSTFASDTNVTAHLNMKFDFNSTTTCSINYLLRECGSALLFAQESNGQFAT